MADLGTVNSFLGRAESRRPETAHLDNHERRGRPGIDREDVYLVTADTQIAAHDVPTKAFQVVGCFCLRKRAVDLSSGFHMPAR